MIQIGKYRLGFAPVSVAVVLVVLSASAVIAAVRQTRPEYPVPLWWNILLNECLALTVSVVYGVVVHFVIVIIDRLRK